MSRIDHFKGRVLSKTVFVIDFPAVQKLWGLENVEKFTMHIL